MPLARACHLQPTLAVTAFATALAAAVGRGWGVVLVALAVLTGQLSVGWSNDYLDRHRDRLAERTDKPIPSGAVPAATVGGAAVVAAGVCVPLSLASGVTAGLVHLGAVAAGWSYNLGLKSTPVSVVPYVLAFGALPVFVTTGLPGAPWPAPWVVAAGALLGAGAHFVNTLPDRAADRRTGVRGLPQRMPAAASLVVGASLLGAATVLVALGPPGAVGATGAVTLAASAVGLGGVVAAVLSGHERSAWSATIAVAAVAVAGLIAGGDSLVA